MRYIETKSKSFSRVKAWPRSLIIYWIYSKEELTSKEEKCNHFCSSCKCLSINKLSSFRCQWFHNQQNHHFIVWAVWNQVLNSPPFVKILQIFVKLVSQKFKKNPKVPDETTYLDVFMDACSCELTMEMQCSRFTNFLPVGSVEMLIRCKGKRK